MDNKRIKLDSTTIEISSCPLSCGFRGADVLSHVKEHHPRFINQNTVFELNLETIYAKCCVFFYGGKEYLLHLIYSLHPSEINLDVLNSSNIMYTVELFSLDFKKRLLIQIETSKYRITKNIYEFISTTSILIKINVHDALMGKIEKAIVGALECPICLETINTQKIRQCQTGHSFCETCIAKLSQCSICQQSLTDTVNYALMQLRSETLRRCKNKGIVCNFEGPPYQLLKHEAFCHRYECPFKNSLVCQFVGSKKGLMQHCLNQHPQLMSNKQIIQYNYPELSVIKTSGLMSCSTIKSIIYAYGNIFRIIILHEEENTFWLVKLYDSKEEAKKYTFHIQFKEEGRRKMLFSDTCRSEIDETINISENGVHIPVQLLDRLTSACVCSIYVRNERTN